MLTRITEWFRYYHESGNGYPILVLLSIREIFHIQVPFDIWKWTIFDLSHSSIWGENSLLHTPTLKHSLILMLWTAKDAIIKLVGYGRT